MKTFLIKGSRKLPYPLITSLFIFTRFINLFMQNGKKRKIELFFFQLHKYFKYYTSFSLYRIIMFHLKYFTPLFKTFKYNQSSSVGFNRGFYKPLKSVFFRARLLKQTLKKGYLSSFYETFLTNIFNLNQQETVINLPFLTAYEQLFFDRKWHKKAMKLIRRKQKIKVKKDKKYSKNLK
jgi:hypothetical protein